MGAYYFILIASVAEIVVTLVGLRWVHRMLKALASGIDSRFAYVDQQLQRLTPGGQMSEPR